MLSHSAMTKLKAIFIIDVIIVAVVAGSYVYLENQGAFITLAPAEFAVSDLVINPVEAGVNQPITISVNVTNVGEEKGNYSVNLTINDALIETKTILLLGGESKIVEFIVTENTEGSYAVQIGELIGAFIIVAVAPPPNFRVSDLTITPNEAWANETIKISAKVSNIGKEADSYSAALRVNDTIRKIQKIHLSAGETAAVEFTVTESREGTYSVIVGGLTGKFKIVPTGKHTLIISSLGNLEFTINGETHTTPFNELVDVGTYTITFPEKVEFPTRTYIFVEWENGLWSLTRTINLQGPMVLVAEYSVTRSCPSLYIWNGTKYVYRTEVSSGTGYLGIFDYFRTDGSLAFLYSNPWDYIKLENSQIQPRNGYYDIKMTQVWDEIFYIDAVKLTVVDHALNMNVFSTKGTYLYKLDDQGMIYTVSKNPSPPVSAFSIGDNGEKADVLAQILALDGVYTTGNEFHWDTLELDLGDLSGAEEIKLVAAGVIVYSSGEVQGEWASQFWDKPGVKPFPPPYMEIKVGDDWVAVPNNKQFPLLLVTPESFVVNLTGLFPANTTDYSIRIHTWFETLFDYIAVDTTSQQDVIIREIYPFSATLTQEFERNPTSTGNFTKYGDISTLVFEADDKFVIGRQGDSVTVLFNAAEISEVPAGMERDYFVFLSCWFKVPGLPYIDFTVDPLPYHAMSAFPYSDTESYPYDEDHKSYLQEYNIRIIP